MIILFILKTISIFTVLSPAIAAGAFWDWHIKKSGQEKTKDALGDIYLKVSYGSLFQDYCSYIIAALNRLNLLIVYLIILASFFICAISINYFLFHDFRFREILFGRYVFLSFGLSVIGLIDFSATKKLLSLAAGGRYKTSAILSLIFIYFSSVGASAFISTFFLKLDGLDYSFYSNFFLNRFSVMMFDPLSGMIITSSIGRYVAIIVFALPAIVISTSTLVASAIVLLLASKKLSPLYDYLADHIFTHEEKSIHRKLVTVVCVFASVSGSLISMLF